MKCFYQRWRPRGHILKSLALKPQVLENCPVLGSWTALFFEWLKFVDRLKIFFLHRFFWRAPKNFFLKTFRYLFIFGDRLKNITKDLFFRRTLSFFVLGPWPRAFLSLASSLVSSTPPLVFTKTRKSCAIQQGVYSSEIRKVLDIKPLVVRNEKSQLTLLGFGSRMHLERLSKQALLAKSNGKRPVVGRPRIWWINEDLEWNRLRLHPNKTNKVRKTVKFAAA